MRVRVKCKDCGRRGELELFMDSDGVHRCPRCRGERMKYHYLSIGDYNEMEVNEAQKWWRRISRFERSHIIVRAICDEYHK